MTRWVDRSAKGIGRLPPTFVGWLAFEGAGDYSRFEEYGDTLPRDAGRFEVNTLPCCYNTPDEMEKAVAIISECS